MLIHSEKNGPSVCTEVAANIRVQGSLLLLILPVLYYSIVVDGYQDFETKRY